MKDITLKIIGRQLFKDREEEQMEFVTDGRLYFRNGAAYVVYEESGVSGMPSGKTVLKVKDDTVRMRRAGGEVNAELYFERGKRFSSTYDTPYGSMGVEVLTNLVENGLDTETGSGKISINYDDHRYFIDEERRGDRNEQSGF